MANNNNRTATSTQIRTFYCEESCLTMKFYNTNLSFHFHPALPPYPDGRHKYDTNNSQITSVNTEGAFALYKAASDIIDEKVSELTLEIDGGKDAKLRLQKTNEKTTFSIIKNGITVTFTFERIKIQETINGVPQTKEIEIGLGSWMKTIEGYLTGINADRHLDKLTEQYAKLQEETGSKFGNKNFFNKGGYKPSNQFTLPGNANNNTPQSFNSYKLPN